MRTFTGAAADAGERERGSLESLLTTPVRRSHLIYGKIAATCVYMLASLVLTVAPWPWLFGINLPLGLLALAFAWPSLPDSRPQPHGFDAVAAALTALGFAALVLGARGNVRAVQADMVYKRGRPFDNQATRTGSADPASASAAPWLPEECVTTPRAAMSSASDHTALQAPRNLKAPMRCRCSALKASVAPVSASSARVRSTGVTCACGAIRAAAASTSSKQGADAFPFIREC